MLLLTLFSLFFQTDTVHILDGYVSNLSVYPGESVDIFLNANASVESHNIRLYDLNGEVVGTFPMRIFPQEPLKNNSYENGFAYKKSATIRVPALVSGVYMWENLVPMVVKSRQAKLLILYTSNTENAYTAAGGKSLYDFNSDDGKRAHKVSFQRPIGLPRHAEAFLRWIVKQPLNDVGYVTDGDLENYAEIRRASLLIIPGHSEYWTYDARKNFDRFVSDGKNAIVLSGNTMWWQVRYDRKRNHLICYKSASEDNIKNPRFRTTRWSDPTLGYPITKSIGVEFSLGGYGRKVDNGWDGFRITCDSPLLEETGLSKGDVLYCSSDEYDGTPLLGFNAGTPVVNRMALGFEKVEIVGFDLSSYHDVQGVATWIVAKPTKKSGIIINTATTDWCSDQGIGASTQIRTITMNMINKLLNKKNVFSPTVGTDAMPIIAH